MLLRGGRLPSRSSSANVQKRVITRPAAGSLGAAQARREGRAPARDNRQGRRRRADIRAQATTIVKPSPSSGKAGLEGKVVVWYRGAWPTVLLHGSINGGEWKDYEMEQIHLSGITWHCLELERPPAGANSDAALLEFALHDGGGQWDNAHSGGNYVVGEPGMYRVADGQVACVGGRAVLVVSDLDDTMMGDDAATAAFKAYYENCAALRGARLAYNTGRALDKFKALLDEKGWCMAQPDALISSVGTKIYLWQGGEWEEDVQYAARLSEGWQLPAVRDAAYAALAAVGADAMHFRPPEEQNEFKVTCGVQLSVLDTVLASIRADLAAAGVSAQLVYSGKDDWRFLDIIPSAAGKLPALEYVRRKWGFGLEETVACGDSGNDIDMLSGYNRAIVVGNAQPDLIKWVDRLSNESKAGRLYRAQAHMAHGVLEGLHHFGFL